MNDQNENSLPPVESASVQPRKLHWPWFTLALVLPPVLTMLAITSEQRGDTAAFTAMWGSPVGGLICGWLLARRVTRTTTGRVLATLGFTVLFGAVIFCLCFAGCLAGAAAKGRL